jgi:hypothetical protein
MAGLFFQGERRRRTTAGYGGRPALLEVEPRINTNEEDGEDEEKNRRKRIESITRSVGTVHEQIKMLKISKTLNFLLLRVRFLPFD